ncbi:MAG: hypothetical protein AABY06_01525 [Nanoarchaeota archaeon]
MNKLCEMKIGIDIDEVLADLMNPLINFHNDNYNTKLHRDHFKTYNLWDIWGGTEEEANQKLQDFFHSRYFMEVKPIENSQKNISILSRKYDLVIITSRPDYIKEKTVSWLNQNFSNNFAKYYFTCEWPKNGMTRKEQICSERGINLIIEDSLEKSLACSKKGINVLLFDCPWNKYNFLPENITRVKNWNEILERIK